MECNFCVNKSNCGTCIEKGWKVGFIPSEKVSKYFYLLSDGRNRFYRFNTTNPDLVNTHEIYMYGKYYCPYCGEEMYPIQDEESLRVLGYCCICDGARAELEYEKEKKELERKHENEMYELCCKYHDILSFDTDKLFKVKQEIERKRYERFSRTLNHFTYINGKNVNDIKDII